MTVKKLIICLLLLALSPCVSFAQDVEINIEYNSLFDIKSFGSDSHTLEYKGYSLKVITSQILNVPEEFVLIDATLAEKRISIRIRTKALLSETNLEPAFTNALKSQLGLLLEKSSKEQIVNVAYLPTDNQINKNKCHSDAGEIKKVVEISGTWTGSCVTIEELLSKVSEWTGEHILNQTINRNSYNLSVSKGEWRQIVDKLDFSFGIVISEEKRTVEVFRILTSN